MCGYSRAALRDDEITSLACMHPAATPGATAFRIHGTDRPGCVAAVSGDVDVDVADLWRLALECADLRPVSGAELVLDASGLTFIDHQRLLELVDYAYQRNTPVVLRDGPEMAARLIDLLNIPFARVESSHGR
jgi:anti-anti-sigma regulatory factor